MPSTISLPIEIKKIWSYEQKMTKTTKIKTHFSKIAVFAKNYYLLVTFKMSLDTQKIGDGVLFNYLTSRIFRFLVLRAENSQNQKIKISNPKIGGICQKLLSSSHF